jgi:hypothetical protein
MYRVKMRDSSLVYISVSLVLSKACTIVILNLPYFASLLCAVLELLCPIFIPGVDLGTLRLIVELISDTPSLTMQPQPLVI